jgi:hypothetical protein
MGIRKKIKDLMGWCPQSPSHFPVKLRNYWVPIAAVLIAGVAFSVFLSLPPLQNVPAQSVPQLPQTTPENFTQPLITPIPTPTATPVPTSIPTPTPMPSPPTITLLTASNVSLELTMFIEKTVFNIGEPVNVTFALTNIGNQTVDLTRTAMNFDFIVTSGGSVVYDYFRSQAFPMWAMTVQLTPGENVTETHVWPQTYLINPSYAPGTQVSPGIYFIEGQSSPMITVGNVDPMYSLQTDPLEILIVGP